MAFAAPGLRAIASTAAAVAFPCAVPQNADAMAIENPDAKATQLTTDDPPPGPCAKTGVPLTNSTATGSNHKSFFICAPSCFNSASVGGCATTLLQWASRCDWIAIAPAEPGWQAVRRSLVSFGNGAAQIDCSQQDKNKGLQRAYSNMQHPEQRGHDDRNQRKEHQRDAVPGQHIGVQAYGERQRASHMADQLNNQHQGRQPPHGAQEGLSIAHDSVVTNPPKVVIGECNQRAARRDGNLVRRRLEDGDGAQRVAEEDEKAEREQYRHELLAAVAPV